MHTEEEGQKERAKGEKPRAWETQRAMKRVRERLRDTESDGEWWRETERQRDREA